jgi:microcystin-dependent protein
MKKFMLLFMMVLFSVQPVFAAGTKISAMPSATTVNAADVVPIVQGGVNKGATVNLFTSGLAATDLLNKVKTVAGAGSGLDADLLDGNHATAFATAAQGTKADNAQPAATAINTTNITSYIVPMTGMTASFAGTSCPTGWLKANGSPQDRTTYSALFSYIGTTYGIGNGSTTFNLPDLRGYFVRAWDDGAGVDSGRAIGTSQADGIKDHTHNFPNAANTYNGGTTSIQLSTNSGYTYNTGSMNGGGTETRPKNIAQLYCIKY